MDVLENAPKYLLENMKLPGSTLSDLGYRSGLPEGFAQQ